SCISRMSDDYHFIPAWKPDFITELEPEDRCHLNGLVVKEGEPKYVTFFAKTDEANGWRKGGFETGMLYDAQQQKPVLDKLPMPHSPIYWNNSIYFLLSATGEVVKYDIEKQESKVIAQVDSFLRGLDIYDHYLFVGASKMRETSKSFKDLPIAKKSFAGIIIIDLITGETVGNLTYTDRISEIFSVRVITNMKLPILLSEKDEGYEKCIHCGDDLNYWLVDEEKNDTKE
ncbi:MAG: TIGR03032 family protein, partial [Cyclobacteriaceae bacterium]|nr:TIGR03032 family protein [Cyclobacteriaceae bacterium]